MLDVFLLLSLSLLLNATPVRTAMLELKLPASQAASSREGESLLVAVGEGDTLRVEGRELPLSDLEMYLHTRQERDSRITVRIQADRNVRYDRLIRVIDAVKNAGMEEILLETRQQRGTP